MVVAETHRTFTFFRILSQIETFYVSSTQSVEATTSCDPVKGADFLTCFENNLVQKQVLLPLVQLLADRGAGSPWACWGALSNYPTGTNI